MPPIKKLQDAELLVETAKFPYASFSFDLFNPVQSKIFEIYDQDANIVVSAMTSAGKTAIAEMMIAHELKVRGGKAMYLGPLKALMQQQIDDWTAETHAFKDYKISVCSGDYRLTADRKKELEEANLIIMTSEMLNSRIRNDKSENNQFLREVKTLIVDEAHLLIEPGRGDHLEVGLMKFTNINKDARIVALSATMPNVDEVSEWLSYSLTGKETYLLESKFRPCPLTIHYEKVYDGGYYDDNEMAKVKYALSLVEAYPEDKFLIFAHGKKTGEMMKRLLQANKMDCEFYNADLAKDKRISLQKRFKTDPKFKYIIATSSLSQGLNFPAKRVIVLGIHRGLTEVFPYIITQMVGRAGRVGYDICGDSYVLLQQSKFNYYKNKLQTPQIIKSQLLNNDGGHYKVLAFHLVSEIHHRDIKTKEDIHNWYGRSLAHWQNKTLDEKILEDTLALLKSKGAIVEGEDGFDVTAIGRIASMFYYSPFDISDLKFNFSRLFASGKEEDEYQLSAALGNIDSHRFGSVSKSELEAMGMYYTRMKKITSATDSAIKTGFAYFELLHGRENPVIASLIRSVAFDFPRLLEVLNALDSMSAKWDRKRWFKRLQLRLRYGVKGDMVYLCEIPNIGKVRAEKLWAANLCTIADIANNPDKVHQVLKLKPDRIKQICDDAKNCG